MEHTVLHENPLFDRKMMIQELIKGRESASKLRKLLQKSTFSRQEDLPEVFINQILSCLSIVLEFLNSSVKEEISEIKDAGDVKSNDSNPKRKNSAVGNDQRRNNRRRKQENTRTIWTKTPLNDGQAWRKYGQKVIQNAKYPRCYFRCTHKYDKNCPAVKQVQRDEEDGSKFKVIYMEEHTCGIKNEMQQTQSNSSSKHPCFLNLQPQDAKSMEKNSVLHFVVQSDHNSQNTWCNSEDDADGSDIDVENFLSFDIQKEWDYPMISTGTKSGDMISRFCSPTFDDVFSFDQKF